MNREAWETYQAAEEAYLTANGWTKELRGEYWYWTPDAQDAGSYLKGDAVTHQICSDLHAAHKECAK